MSADPARGLAHLIGSVPLPTTEDVFRRLGATLGPLLSRMPDGETGERRRWIYWQRTMLERHPAMEVDPDAGLLELRQWDGSLLRHYLGLLHHDDRAGDRRRIDVARDAVPAFGVATECGWGRGEPARLAGLLESHRQAVDYLVTRR